MIPRGIVIPLLIALLAVPFQVIADEAEIERGRAIYNFRCYFCHGYSGDARTLAATFLSPPPANFRAAGPGQLDREKIVDALRNGRPGTAMKAFSGIISNNEMEAVAAFVIDEFIHRKAENTHYHTAENGWSGHERYKAAFPFALGEIPVSRPWENLSAEEADGKRLYLSSCVSCHDHGLREAVTADDSQDIIWDSRPLSFPRNGFSLASANPSPAPKVDAMSSASPYLLHDIRPRADRL